VAALTNDAPVHPGDVLGGKYRVERVLGSGGMGVVVAAVHVELGQRVALKFVLPHALGDGEVASRFLREARAAVKIDSEHVARVLDVGRLESQAPFMVMEYLEGHDLSLHARGASLPIEQAVDFILQACSGMAVAHSVGIVHRDLKPANLFVTTRPDGSELLKVLDFGISKMSVLDAPVSLTNTSAMMGSPLYMSPEQAQNARDVDGRTDIWSLGVILYELITGLPPFPGETLGEVLSRLMTEDPQPMTPLRPEVPAGLELAIRRALEKPRERRFANIGELTAALVEFAPVGSRALHDRISGVMSRAGFSSAPPPQVPVQAKSVAPPAPSHTERMPAPLVSATATSWAERAKEKKKPFPLGRALGAGVTVAGLATAALFGTLHQGSGPASSAAPSVALAAAAREVPVPTPQPAVGSVGTPSVTAELAPTAAAAGSSGSSALAGSSSSPPASSRPSVTSALPPAAAPHRIAVPGPSSPSVPPPAAAPPRAAAAATATRKKNPLSIDFK